MLPTKCAAILVALIACTTACELVWEPSNGLNQVASAINVLQDDLNAEHPPALDSFAYFARQGNNYGYVRPNQATMTGAFLCKSLPQNM